MKTLEDKILECPYCGFDCLHQVGVEVFERNEDEEKGVHSWTRGTGVSVDTDISRNPSSRRQGVLIHFWCEGCDRVSSLSISQHKGNTFFNYKL